MQERWVREYKRQRRAGIPAALAFARVKSARETDALMWSLDWEECPRGAFGDSYAQRAVIQRTGYAIALWAIYDEDGGIVPDFTLQANQERYEAYYETDAEWGGYVVEAIAPDGTILAEDSCWGRETNFPDTLVSGLVGTITEWVGVDRWIVNGKPAPTILEGIAIDAERELRERGEWAARGMVTA